MLPAHDWVNAFIVHEQNRKRWNSEKIPSFENISQLQEHASNLAKERDQRKFFFDAQIRQEERIECCRVGVEVKENVVETTLNIQLQKQFLDRHLVESQLGAKILRLYDSGNMLLEQLQDIMNLPEK